jgi:hypothetical protein
MICPARTFAKWLPERTGLFYIWLPAIQGSPGSRPAIFASLPVHELHKLPADKIVREHSHQTKTVVVPLIVRVIVVAVGNTRVFHIVVPRAAAQSLGLCPIRQAIRPV